MQLTKDVMPHSSLGTTDWVFLKSQMPIRWGEVVYNAHITDDPRVTEISKGGVMVSQLQNP